MMATMNSSSFPSVSNRKYGDVTTSAVTEQFKVLRVSGDGSNAEEENMEEFLRVVMRKMRKVGISANDVDPEKMEALAKEMSGVSIQSGAADKVPTNQNQTGASQSSQSPRVNGASSKSIERNESRRGRSHRSRSRTPMGTRLNNVIRSVSPTFRRTKSRSRSPIPNGINNNVGSPKKMTTDGDADEFYEAHSTMESFMANSPSPKPARDPSTQSVSSAQKRPPTPLASGRPPLTSVKISEVKTLDGNSPLGSPLKQSSFKFDKDQDKFNVGISPPKKSKFGSPGKKARSPSNRSRPLTSPIMQHDHQPEASPLQGSPLTEAGSQANPSPSPYKAGGKPPTNNRYSSSQAIGGAPSLFASPVPELFHAPDTFIRIPSPHNIMENDSQIGAAARRQTAPPNMSTAAATAAAEALRKSSSAFPKTPFDRSQEATGAPNTAPDTADTAETLIKKKTRNSATPNLDPTSPMFNVDLSRKPDSTKVNGKRGSTTRKGSNNNSYGFTKTTTNSNFPFGLDEIKEAGTDDTAPTESESPSNGSTLSMDTSPFLSPPSVEQKQSMYSNTGAEISQGFNATAQFSLGVGGKQSQAGANVKSRTKRKDNKGRRAQFHRSQSAHVSGPSQSTFDLNHNRTNQAEALARTRTEIAALKDRGKAFYGAAKYKESIRVYSQAIEKFKLELFAHVPAKDLLAVLLSNRAAALLMVGAYESAAEDSRNGIHFVTDPRNKNADFASPDANPALRPKLYTRMGRSYLKLGKVDDADRAFSEAIESAKVMQDFQRRQNVVEMHDGSGLDQIKTDSILGQSDVLQLRKLLGKINELQGQRSVQPRSARDQAMESLGLVKIALKTANGSYELHETKVKLLAELKRWREVASHCERFAVSNVSFDGCLINDLSSKNPFPNVPIAKRLRPDYFGDTKEDELKGAEMKLDRNSASEAILRLPYSMMPYYLRSLRLNERYYIAENCISALDKLARERAATSGESFYSHLLWLPEEREKLRRTKNERELGDNMFSNAEYEKAALRYAECLIIDSGSNQNCAGGRLHAILHCNRAACFMATKRYREAMNECTSALRIYPRYLKALLRRARCYSRLDRTRESESDYKYWLEIVNHSREGKSNPVLGDCVFDGPHTVKDKEMNDVQAELSDLLEAKARAEAEERVRQARNNYHEQSRKQQYHYNNNTNSGSNHNRKKSPAHEDAHRRRENFYSSQNSSRRWDSFKDRSQNGGQEKPKSRKTKKDDYGYKVQSSPRDNNDHYSSLGIDRRATAEEIKKAYKKMALKYHPDKNKDNATAAENFLRIKDAYETLKDPSARRKYDSKSRRGRY